MDVEGKSLVALFFAVAVASCDSPAPTQERFNPMVVAEEYASAHYAAEVPKGLARAWHVEDHGELWTVEMFHQGTVGGGIKVAIRKSDGKVIGSELTQ